MLNQKQHATKRTRGKRGGAAARNAALRDIHSKVRGVATHGGFKSNFAATVVDNTVFYDAVDALNETVETHVVPRRSLTRKQLLGIFPQRVETAPIPTRQLDKQTGKMVATTENRVTWKSDRSLLNRTPSNEIGTFKREGSVSVGLNTRRTITTIKEESLTETVLGPAIEDEDMGPEQ